MIDLVLTLQVISPTSFLHYACNSCVLGSVKRNVVRWEEVALLSFMGQFSPVTQSCPTLCDPVNCGTPGLPIHHRLPESIKTHVHWVGDTIQPSHPLSSPSPPALNLSQHQGLFKWVSSSYQMAKVLEFQSTSVLPMNTQDWSPLGWIDWIPWAI